MPKCYCSYIHRCLKLYYTERGLGISIRITHTISLEMKTYGTSEAHD